MKFIKEPIIDSSGNVTGFWPFANKEAFIPASNPPAAAAAGGLLAGINASLLAKGKKPVTFPDESMIGSLINFISNRNQILSNQKNKFQPMPASFGLVPELTVRIKDKRSRYKAYQKRSLEALNGFKKILDSCSENDHLLVKIN